MKLLVLDGNSIVNRAFYGIKMLTTKDGRYTNAIYGFINILMRLEEETSPDCVAVAFDLKAPTFRHKMYDGYKANRKGMPLELAGQMPVLKELLTALGYRIVEQEGWEADDILGTLAKNTPDDGFCYIATGDRDSLQLVRENVNVLLASTKMGRPQTERYTPEAVKEKYLVAPPALIDIKALMGDSSDCIPGVAGIGEKTAGELISKFGSIDNIYENLDTLDIKAGVKAKLEADRDMAYLSRTLGTIRTDAPIDTDWANYTVTKADAYKVTRLLTDLEMFKILEKLSLEPAELPKEKSSEKLNDSVFSYDDTKLLYNVLKKSGKAYFITVNGSFFFALENGVGEVSPLNPEYNGFLEDFLFDRKIKKITYNVKALYAFAFENGFEINGVYDDVMLSAYILNPSSGAYSLQRIMQEYISAEAPAEENGTGFYTAKLPLLSNKLSAQIEANGQRKLLSEIEIPLSQVLASMELEGFEVDKKGISDFSVMLGERIEKLVSDIYADAGYEFNINSPKQLGEALFEKMGIPCKKKTKSGYSTSADVLEGLADEYPVVAKILEYRTYAKLRSTYCEGLIKAIGDDGRIHSVLNQTETRTGRISSSEPNLQNIPVRSELGREMRRFFRAGEGNVLVDADYSQIELRVLACIAQDEEMINAFNRGDDIHTITASQVFNMPLNMVTPLMRSRAKAVNFGIVYGIGAFSLAKDIGVSRAEADSYIKGYLAHYQGVARYMKQIVEKAKGCGYVETLFARRRYLPELTSSNAMLRAFGERVALNMPIQGTAADIIKIAMIKVYNGLHEHFPDARLIMQVHDELIIECPEGEAKKVEALVKSSMQDAVKTAVLLEADVHSGKTWYDAK